jgi:hypothetical protein
LFPHAIFPHTAKDAGMKDASFGWRMKGLNVKMFTDHLSREPGAGLVRHSHWLKAGPASVGLPARPLGGC